MNSITLAIPVILGWLAGWFVNYLADVLPATRRFSQPVCPRCGETLPWQDYLLFRPCRNGHSRPGRFWGVQIVITAMSVHTWINPPVKASYFWGLILLTYFGIVFVTDLEHRLILHPTSIFGAAFGLVFGLVTHELLPTLLGGLGGFGIMMVFYLFGILFTRIRARRLAAMGQEPDDEEALGFGDVILATILGLIVGWPLLWLCLLYGVLLGGLVSLILVVWMLASGRYKTNALMVFIPYGPYFIITAGLIVYFPKLLAMVVPG